MYLLDAADEIIDISSHSSYTISLESQLNLVTVAFGFNNLYQFLPGYYYVKVNRQYFVSTFSETSNCYFMTSGRGKFTALGQASTFTVSNRVLIDADYQGDIILGIYIASYDPKIPTGLMEFQVCCLQVMDDPESLRFFSMTQSPTFNSAPFPANSQFHSIYKSSASANGYDLVFMNLAADFIAPYGNLVCQVSDTVRTDSSGEFILRSRYTRKGLSLYCKDGLFLITNNSPYVVHIKPRLLQYVPLRTFNNNCCNSSIIQTWCSFKTIQQYSDHAYVFGQLTTSVSERKAKLC
jgi:hypothetical protein